MFIGTTSWQQDTLEVVMLIGHLSLSPGPVLQWGHLSLEVVIPRSAWLQLSCCQDVVPMNISPSMSE